MLTGGQVGQTAAKTRTAPSPSFRTVLIADDDPLARTILANYFASLQTERIDQAADGQKAIATLRQNGGAYDLVVTDLNMPNADGVQFIGALHEHQFKGEVLIASGEARNVLETAGELARLHELRILGQIPKPLNKQKLDEVLVNSQPIAGLRT